ncbi:MAG: hypothetical protein QXQ94_10830 [Candidatus Bathyarchaeia archaeon]
MMNKVLRRILTFVINGLLFISMFSVLPQNVQAFSNPSILNVGISYENSSVPNIPPITQTPGGVMRLWYRLYNPNNFSVDVVLGGSIQIGGLIYSDPAHELKVTLKPGDSLVYLSRHFCVPSGIPSGTYNVIFTIWSSDKTTQYHSITKLGWINMINAAIITFSSSPPNVGTIIWDNTDTYNLPATISTTTRTHILQIITPTGYEFDHLEHSGNISIYSFNPCQYDVNVYGHGSLTAVFKGGAPTQAPSLVSPANGASLSSGTVTFSWSSVSGATRYELQVSGPAAYDIVDITGTSYTLSLSASGSYTWRVRGYNSAGYGPWSPSWSFTLKAVSAPSTAPSLVSPNNGAILSRAVVTFSWSPVPGATYYELFVSGENFAFAVTYITDTSYSSDLVISGSYTWKVRGFNDVGYGPWSDSWTFTNLYPAWLKISSIKVEAKVLSENKYFVNPGESIKVKLLILNGEKKLNVRVNLCIKDPSSGASIYDSKDLGQDKKIWLDCSTLTEITFDVTFPEVCSSPLYLVYATVTDWSDPMIIYDFKGGWENSPSLYTWQETENAIIETIPYVNNPPSTFEKTLEFAISFMLKKLISEALKEVIGRLAGTIVGSIIGVFLFPPSAGNPPKCQLYLITESKVTDYLNLHPGEKATLSFAINPGNEIQYSIKIICRQYYPHDKVMWTEEVKLYYINDAPHPGVYHGFLKREISFYEEGYYIIEFSYGSSHAVAVVVVHRPGLILKVNSPVDILLIDPIGRRCGYDPNIGIVNEIDGAYYSGPLAEPEIMIVPEPLIGNYNLRVHGRGIGNYTIEIQTIDLEGNMAEKLVLPGIANNETYVYYNFELQNNYALVPEFPSYIIILLLTFATPLLLKKRKERD